MKRILICCLCVSVVLLTLFALSIQRPLIRSSDYVAIARNTNGTSYVTVVYQPLLMPHRIHVNLPESPDTNYQWFGIDLDLRVVGACNTTHRRFPGILFIDPKPTGSLGIGLLDPKIEDRWTVSLLPNKTSFSNSWLMVELQRQ